jgi:TELO2-interacting protein 1
VRCLELAVRCLKILLEKGWRQRLGPDMGKQLLILLTILAGGSPARDLAERRSEELTLAALQCIKSLLNCLVTREHMTLFNQVGSATIVDQAVFVLLEEITGGVSEGVQLAALEALQILLSRISNRQILASLFPRTVSSLTKVLTPSTQTRRSQKVLVASLQLLTEVLRAVLNDAEAIEEMSVATKDKQGDAIVLDASWLKATASQVKVALANVVRLKSHDRPDVREALLQLCLMVIEQCEVSLADSQIMMLETVVALSNDQEDRSQNDAFLALKHLVISQTRIVDILRSSLHDWTLALPRVMQTNDDAAKQRALKQISIAFEVLSQAGLNVEILDETLASTLCDSLSAVIRVPNASASREKSVGNSNSNLEIASLNDQENLTTFQPVLMGNRSQMQTLSELQSTVKRLTSSESSLALTRATMNKLYRSSGDDLVASFWFTLNFLKADSLNVDEFLDFGPTSLSRPAFIEELYSVSLPILLDLPDANPTDWRLPALALESITLQAQQLKSDFRPELIDALYPTLQLMGSSNALLRSHAMTALNILSSACEYASTSEMLISNVDYLVNSVALKLNTFDISPQAPQVLLMMIKLCGAPLIPYLDDLVGSIFAALDCYHGYPRLVELLFSVLGAIVEEATNATAQKAISATSHEKQQLNPHRKKARQPFTISDLAAELSSLAAPHPEPDGSTESYLSHPNRPFTSSQDGPRSTKTPPDDDDPPQESSPEEKEPHLSPTQTLTLSILQCLPSHLSSPSPTLRASLLNLLSTTLSPSPPKPPIDIITSETHFLPLINTLWPSVSVRIYDPEVYVAVAAAAAMSGMMPRAGDFMASRVETELPRWKKLYLRVWKGVKGQRDKRSRRELEFRARQIAPSTSTSSAKGNTVSSHISGPTSASTSKSTSTALSKSSTAPAPSLQKTVAQSGTTNDPDTQLFNALAALLVAVLGHVRLDTDIGDEIVELLALGGVRDNETVKEAIEVWNEDLLWLILQREDAEGEEVEEEIATPRVAKGERGLGALESLGMKGLSLSSR